MACVDTEQRIYVGQTALALDLDTCVALVAEGAVSAVMHYIKPDGTTGSWTAVIAPSGYDTTVRYVVDSASDLDQAGLWKRWCVVTFAASKTAPSDAVYFNVEEIGS